MVMAVQRCLRFSGHTEKLNSISQMVKNAIQHCSQIQNDSIQLLWVPKKCLQKFD